MKPPFGHQQLMVKNGSKQSQDKLQTILLARKDPKANLPYTKIGNRHGFGVNFNFYWFFVDLPSASDRVTVMFSQPCWKMHARWGAFLFVTQSINKVISFKDFKFIKWNETCNSKKTDADPNRLSLRLSEGSNLLLG